VAVVFGTSCFGWRFDSHPPVSYSYNFRYWDLGGLPLRRLLLERLAGDEGSEKEVSVASLKASLEERDDTRDLVRLEGEKALALEDLSVYPFWFL
jgi:hypothetical protein